jgi:DNA-binding response OmpR family regulator
LATEQSIRACAAAGILVLAADTSVGTRLGYTLRQAGYSVRLTSQSTLVAPQALRGVHLVLVGTFDSPLQTESYCQAIKGSEDSPLVIVLGPDDLSLKLRLFIVGIDDYIPDSCHALELLARIKSLIRRRMSAKQRDNQFLQTRES